MNLGKAIAAFFAVLRGREFPAPASAVPAPAPPPPPAPAADRFAEGAVFTLALLQRHSRLVDFIQEDISAYDDAQVGTAVRKIHADARQTINETFGIAPVLNSPENTPAELGAGFDPSAIRLTGNVPPAPPYRGILRHGGWRAAKIALPVRVGAGDPSVVCPAEIEI